MFFTVAYWKPVVTSQMRFFTQTIHLMAEFVTLLRLDVNSLNNGHHHVRFTVEKWNILRHRSVYEKVNVVSQNCSWERAWFWNSTVNESGRKLNGPWQAGLKMWNMSRLFFEGSERAGLKKVGVLSSMAVRTDRRLTNWTGSLYADDCRVSLDSKLHIQPSEFNARVSIQA
jgi:hypothetical protein